MNQPAKALTAPSRLPDQIGIAATTLCILHCLAMPILISLSVAWGVPLITEPSFERFMLFGTLIFACIVMLRSCQVHHHSLAPLGLAATGGLFYLFKGLPGEALEPAMVVIGGTAIVAAHVWNMRLCRGCVADSAGKEKV